MSDHRGPEAVFAGLAGEPGAVWLDGGPDSWSILSWDPAEILTEPDRWPERGRSRRRSAPRSRNTPFSSGVIGYIGYGSGYVVEPVPRGAPTPEPPLWLGRYEGALCWHPQEARWHISGPEAFQRQARERIDEARALPPPQPPTAVRGETTPRERFEASVQRILALIRQGDCYQVNLSRPVHVEGIDDPFSIYRRLRSAPARYGALLRLSPEVAILSNSPELFVSLRGRSATSLPIKGTRRRSADEIEDHRLWLELRDSPKDRAELTMIVDLVRNDLGKIAAVGTVRAGERQIESFPTVHHSLWPVTAELLPGLDAWDLLAATFPPGSVTGAPKVRACERIDELEPEPRGVYCGAIGYVDDGGDSTWSVAIRTAVTCGRRARYHVGGGIVADSDPAAEWEETVTKELALRRALLGLTR